MIDKTRLRFSRSRKRERDFFCSCSWILMNNKRISVHVYVNEKIAISLVPLLTRTYVGYAPYPQLPMLFKPIRLKYLLSFKPVKLLNKMVYFHELKLLQKKNLSQFQICYFFSINRNMTLWKKNMNFYKL